MGVVCAISDDEVGVDIQNIISLNAEVAQIVCTDRELSIIHSSHDHDGLFCKLWTLKESYLKALGTELTTQLKEVSFEFCENVISSNKPGWHFKTFQEGGYYISVCSRKKVPNEYQKVSVADIKEKWVRVDSRNGINPFFSLSLNGKSEWSV